MRRGPGGDLVDFPDLPRLPRGGGKGFAIALAVVAILVLLFDTYYQIAPYEKGVVLRFGKLHRIAEPGPNLKIPIVDRVFPVPVERQLKEEFGFRTIAAAKRSTYQKEGYADESLMLTGDLSIADVEWVVQYRISDPFKYLFAVRDAPETIRDVVEAEMRGVVGDMGFNEVIKERRHDIEEEVKLRLQDVLDDYNAGVDIKLVQLQDVHPPNPVKDSFEEVNRALQEMERAINEAMQERNKVIFRAEGEAKQRIAVAEGFTIERINRAEGESERFRLLLAEYRKAPEVTRQRLYLEAMQKALPQTDRILIVDEEIQGLLPLLDLTGKAASAGGGGTP